jgi:putative methionine-R-sulfoxide reductase with GAF domain
VLALAFGDKFLAESFTSRVVSIRELAFLGRHLAQRRQVAIDRRVAAAARRILSASEVSSPEDTGQAVAEAIRNAAAIDGRCLILKVEVGVGPAGGMETTLEVLVPLAGQSSPGEPSSPSAGEARLSLPWQPQLGTSLGDTGGLPVFRSRLQLSDSRMPTIETDRYEMVPGTDAEMGATIRLAGAQRDGSGREAVEIDQPIGVVGSLLSALHQRGLVGAGSCVTVPLFDADELLGFLVTSSPGDRAFSGRDVTRIGDLGMLVIRPLARSRQLERDYELARLILGEAAALTGAHPVAGNRQLRDLLTDLCERLRRVVRADSSVLLPYDHKRDLLIENGMAHAGRWGDVPRSRRPSPKGVVSSILTMGEVDWSISRGDRFDPDSFIGRHAIGRVCATALRAPSGAAVGVLICNWAMTPEQLAAATDSSPAAAIGVPASTSRTAPRPSAELNRIRDFAKIAAEFLQRQVESSNLAELHDALFDLYGRLLVETGTAFAGESADTPRKVRDDLLEQILKAAIGIVGGTAGIFAMPSFDHDGLDVVVKVGGSELTRINYGEGVTGACALQGLVQVIQDSRDPDTYPPGVRPIPRVKGSRSEMAYPVHDSGGRLLGVIDIENEIATGAFVEADASPVLQPLAQAATLVIQLTDSIAHLASIARLSRALDDAQGQAEDTIARVTLDEVREVTGAFAATARVPDQRAETLIQLAHAGESGAWTGSPLPLHFQGANTTAYRDGKVVRIDDVRKLRLGPVRSHAEYLPSRAETRSEIALPVTHHSQRIGVLDFDHRQPGAFVASEAYLRVVARQFGHALSARRDSQRRLVAKSHDMVKVLNAYYVKINHSIASRFTSIRHKLDELERRHVDCGTGLAGDLREIYAIADIGIREADGLLAASAGSYENEQELDARRVLLSAIHADWTGQVDTTGVFGEPVSVYGREQMLRWVFREIVSNSLRYGGDHVRVTASMIVDAQKGLVVAVLEDDGPGIPAEELGDLFTVRGRDRSQQREGGGLAMVGARAFLDTMRGAIAAEVVSPHGLRITITLPIYRGRDGS